MAGFFMPACVINNLVLTSTMAVQPMTQSKQFKVACIQATPHIFDVEKLTEKVISLTKEAAAKGCKLVVFPETFIPGFPAGLGFETVIGSRTPAGREQFNQYWQNSVEVPGPYTEKLGV